MISEVKNPSLHLPLLSGRLEAVTGRVEEVKQDKAYPHFIITELMLAEEYEELV